jgi:hypothetical protein
VYIQLLAVVLKICLFAGLNLNTMPSYPPSIGDPHPDFVLPNIDTNVPVSLSQFLGKKIILINFASW